MSDDREAAAKIGEEVMETWHGLAQYFRVMDTPPRVAIAALAIGLGILIETIEDQKPGQSRDETAKTSLQLVEIGRAHGRKMVTFWESEKS